MADGQAVNRGTTVLFHANPAEGYSVKEWKLNGLTIGGNTSDTYVITGIAGNAVVTVEFTVPVDKAALAAAIKAAGEIEEKYYTASTWSVFASAFAGATAVNIDRDATQTEVDAAIAALAAAVGGLAEKLPMITSIKIDAKVTETVERGRVYSFGVIHEEEVLACNIVWTLSDNSFGLIDDEGRLYILNKTGTVRLIATDTVSGLAHSITLRIAS